MTPAAVRSSRREPQMDSTKKAQSGQLIKVKKVESNVRYGSLPDQVGSDSNFRSSAASRHWTGVAGLWLQSECITWVDLRSFLAAA